MTNIMKIIFNVNINILACVDLLLGLRICTPLGRLGTSISLKNTLTHWRRVIY